MALSRADNSILGRWWWTVDRWTLAALMVLIGFGYVLMLAASPAVAERIGASSRHMFFLKQVFYLALAAAVMVGVSLLSPRGVRRFALLGCAGALRRELVNQSFASMLLTNLSKTNRHPETMSSC